jgi:hypothetical protein
MISGGAPAAMWDEVLQRASEVLDRQQTAAGPAVTTGRHHRRD